jgi:hypothetical protein
MLFTPEGLRHLVAQVGASQVMLGTDHPIPWEEHPVDHVFATTTLTDKAEGRNPGRQCGAPVRNEGSLIALNCLILQCSKSFDALSLRICLQPIWPRFENRPIAVNCIPADRPFSR